MIGSSQLQALKRRLPAGVRSRLRAALFRLLDGVDRLRRPGGPPLPPRRLRNVGSGDFRAVGEEFLRIFVDRGGLRPEHRVLDVGCGVGRMALPLIGYLDPGSGYDGTDVVKASIDWCAGNITPLRPDFRFHHADLHNTVYNPEGSLRAADYRFPFAEASFDFVFLTSVFTHLLEADTRCYLQEISRVLRPGKVMLATFFFIRGQPTPEAAFDFSHRRGVCRVVNPERPEQAVAYPEPYLRSLLEANGLAVREPIEYGSWDGRQSALTLQDVVVAERRGAGGVDAPAAAQVAEQRK